MVLQTSIVKSKSEFRRSLIDSRRNLSPDQRRRRSEQICDTLRQLPAFRRSARISSYIGFGEEVETSGLVRELLRERGKVAVPVHGSGRGKPGFAEITSWGDLAPNSLGFLEPLPEKVRVVADDSIDCFLCPGVGFDLRGNRLGYGLGFYDRALQNAPHGSLIVGLALDLQVVESLPVSSHDVPMHLIITETRIIGPPFPGDR
jgi:5-formyltetrahydrofolate cyclo-ligase